jgi:hypothetical protein
METGLIIYAIYIVLMLMWCVSRRSRLRYVMISIDQLNRWAVNCHNLIIIDLRAERIRQSYNESISSALTVSMIELPGLLQWIPPQTTLVLCYQGETPRFDAWVDELLSQAEIHAIYLLVFPICAPLREARMSGDELSDKAVLFPVEQTGPRYLEPGRQRECKN